MSRNLMMVVVAGLALVTATACVSNTKFEGAISDVSGRVDEIQSGVEENSKKIDDVNNRIDQTNQDVKQAADSAASAQGEASAAKEMAHKAHMAARGKVIWKVTLTNRDVVFDVDGAEIGEGGAAALDSLISKFQGLNKLAFLEIQGHSDSTGNEKYNYELGLKRATAVRDYLHENGVPLHLMQVISYGESRPVADNSTKEGRSQNRRVEVRVLE